MGLNSSIDCRMQKGTGNLLANLDLDLLFLDEKDSFKTTINTDLPDFFPLDGGPDLSRYRIKTQLLIANGFFKKQKSGNPGIWRAQGNLTPPTHNLFKNYSSFIRWPEIEADGQQIWIWWFSQKGAACIHHLIRHDLNKWKFFPEKWRLQQKVSPLLRVALKGCYHLNKPRTFYLNIAIQSILLENLKEQTITFQKKNRNSAKPKNLETQKIIDLKKTWGDFHTKLPAGFHPTFPSFPYPWDPFPTSEELEVLTFGDELETFFSHETLRFLVGNAKLNLYFTTGILDRGVSPKGYVIVPWRVSKSCEPPK